METPSTHHAPETVVRQLLDLAEQKYNCSQIMVLLTIPDDENGRSVLVKALAGLANGCGFFKETCGVFTAATCILSWYAEEKAQTDRKNLYLLMQEEFFAWFRQEIDARFKGSRCEDIVGDELGTEAGRKVCGRLILKSYAKIVDILTENQLKREQK